MSEKFNAPEIPDNYVLFAKDMAESARKYGIESFTMIFKPDFDNRMSHSIDGTLKIHFSKADGRGRPANNLSIAVDTSLRLAISATPESSN